MEERAAPWWKSLSRYQWTVLIIAWLGWVFDVFDTSLFFLAKGPIVKEFMGAEAYAKNGMGQTFEAIIVGVFYAGWAVGGLIFGILADRWGRVKTMILTIIIYCFFTLATYACRNLVEVGIIRFFTALGIGGEWAAGTALVAEVLPNRVRSAAASFLQTAAAIGPVLAGFANAKLAHYDWRWLFVVGAFPALLTIWIRLSVKEPERWTDLHKTEPKSPFSTLRMLFADSFWRKRAFVVLVIALVGILGAGNISFWMPNLVKLVSEGFADEALKIRQSNVQMVMHIGTIIGVILFPYLCNKIGRKPSFMAFFLVSPVVVGLFMWSLISGNMRYEQMLFVAPIVTFFVIGLTAGFPLYLPELFPTRFRATGLGFTYNTGRLFLIPWPLLTAVVSAHLGGSIAVGVGLTALVFFIGAFAMVFAPETKGKPLPD